MNKTVDAKTVMLCWNPGYQGGEVALVAWPDRVRASRQDGLQMSTLACDGDFQAAEGEELNARLMCAALIAIVRDGCDPQLVHRTMLGIRQYRDCFPLDAR